MQNELNIIEETEIFSQWLDNLTDYIAAASIAARIERAKSGNFGDHKFLRDEIWEMRIDKGKGYRVYYARKGKITYLLVCGGDKSTQKEDIKQAINLWQQIKNNEEN